MDRVQVLIIVILVLAVLNAISLIWIFYLARKLHQNRPAKHFHVKIEASKVLNEADLGVIQQQAEQELRVVMSEAASKLQNELNSHIGELASNIGHIAESTASQEFEKYRVQLEALESQSVQQFSSLEKDLNKMRQELIADLQQKVTAERAARMDEFNNRLNDVVASYLAESLGNNVDLGAQSIYIMQMLDSHKEDIKRDILA